MRTSEQSNCDSSAAANRRPQTRGARCFLQELSPLLAGLAVSLCVFAIATSFESQEMEELLEKAASVRAILIQHQVDENINALHRIEGLYASSSFVSEEEFGIFTGQILEDEPAILSIAWAPRKSEKERQPAVGKEASVPHLQESLLVDSVRHVAFPIQYGVPRVESDLPLSIDYYRDPELRHLLDLAARTRDPVSLLWSGGRDAALIVVAVYDQRATVPVVTSAEDPRVKGFLFAHLSLSRLLSDALGELLKGGPDVLVWSGAKREAGQEPRLALQGAATGETGHLVRSIGGVPESVAELSVANSHFAVVFRGNEVFPGGSRGSWPLISFLLSLAISILAAHLVRLGRRKKALLEWERQRSAEALAEVRSYKSALDEYVMVTRTDIAGRIIEVNKRCSELSGYAPEELLGKNHRLFNSGHHPKGFFRDIMKIVSSGKMWRGEVCNRRKDGTLYWVDTLIIPAAGADGKIESYIALRIDITARKEAERQLEAEKERAEVATQAKSQFLANMSHEIRTPLTSIIGYSEQLLDSELPAEERRDCSSTVLRNARHLLDLVSGILDFSKIEADKLTVAQEDVDLFALMSFVESALQAGARDKELSFEVEFKYPLPERITSDAMRIKQILLNLLGNAIKFTEKGGVRLEVSYDRENSGLQFAVSDTGIGLTEEQISRLFEAFSQADSTTTKRYGGTGLGLAISQRLGRLLGGEISVVSSYQSGSTFTLTVAAGPVAQERLVDKRPAISSQQVSARLSPLGVRGRVLVAEDSFDNRKLLCRVLEKCGLSVVAVNDGKAAVATALSQDFDLVLMDVQMPVMDGNQATRQLRASGYGVPIVACTADASREHMSRLLKIGCTEVLFKPFSSDSLAEVVQKYLSGFKPDNNFDLLPAELAELRRGFISRLPARCECFREAQASSDLEEVGRLAHKLIGATLFGLPELGRLAQELERASKYNQALRSEELLNNIYKTCETLLEDQKAALALREEPSDQRLPLTTA